jgi:ribosome-associated translation inhibitor RaiA
MHMQIITTFRDMDPSPALQAAAERWAARLAQVCDRIVSCHISVELPHRHQHQGAAFEIHVVISVPGAQIAASNHAATDAYVALGDAFRAARRQLLDHVDLQRGFVKAPSGGHYQGFVASKA